MLTLVMTIGCARPCFSKGCCHFIYHDHRMFSTLFFRRIIFSYMSRLEDVLTLVSQKNTLHLYVITRRCAHPCLSKGCSHFISHDHRMCTPLFFQKKTLHLYVITRGCAHPCFSEEYSHFTCHDHRMQTLVMTIGCPHPCFSEGYSLLVCHD